MSNTQEVETGAATEIQAPEPTETPEVVTSEVVEAEAPSEPEAEEDKTLKRLQKRIDRRTADVYRERARADELARRLAELQAGGSEDTPKQETPDVEALVQKQVAIRAFADRANSIVDAGEKAHPDFMDAVKELAREVGEFTNKDGTPSAFMEVVLDVADDPAKMMYHLGKNPDLASELSELSKYKLAKKLAGIEAQLAESSKPKTSAAPKPIEPVRGIASDNGLRSDLPIEEWMRRREQQIKDKRRY